MPRGHVQVPADGPGKKLATNLDRADSTLHHSTSSVVDGAGDELYGGGKQTFARFLTADDSIEVVTPGNLLRVYWVAFEPSMDNEIANGVTIGFDGAAEPKYAGYAMQHRETFDGEANQSLTIGLENAAKVAVTVHYREVTL